jgi:hypothetical protein
MIALKIFKKILLFLCISLTMLSTNACASTTASNTSNASGSASTYIKTDYHVDNYPDLQVYEVNPTIYIDGKKVDFKALYNRPIINIKDRTMLPLRAFVYYISGIKPDDTVNGNNHVWWQGNWNFTEQAQKSGVRQRDDGITGAPLIELSNQTDGQNNYISADMLADYQYIETSKMTKGSNFSTDNPAYKIDVPPLVTDIAGGTSYIPVRSEAYIFGYGVKFDDAANAIYISKDIPIEFNDAIYPLKLSNNDPDRIKFGMLYGIFDINNGSVYYNQQYQFAKPWNGK